MTVPDLELTEDLRALAARLLHLMAERDRMEAEIRDLKAKIRSTVAVGQRATIDGRPVLAVAENRRFSTEYAVEHLPQALVSLCMTPVFDRNLAKKVLPPALYDGCMRPVGEPIVRAL